ncbi:CPBP family intramembrane glutamic endopeptidase [Cohnella silvisoli]|uniref:CPBP family intramembrane metalloprotease n=1 Tax=Cohnella silvisoli TaxID=2873699 RepID=A0ABV1KWD4_9BACL|nr:CPBP family intramembrane glutamic endopeptidase [Cohnella silvisoli]MCD9023979.1 CorA family divalent cation transporter [Cohnella silvisoli]
MDRLSPFQLDKRWLWTAAIGLLLFLLIQVFPVTGQLFTTDVHPVMTRTTAENKAFEWATSRFGIKHEEVDAVTVTHLSDSDTVGYFTKNQLMDSYNKKWSKFAPTDVYAVKLHLRDKAEALLLYIHMETGKLVAWQHLNNAGATNKVVDKPVMETDKLAAHALDYAQFWGVTPQDWEWIGNDKKTGSVKFVSRKANIGESRLWLKVAVPDGFSVFKSSFPPWAGGSVTYGVDLPASFTAYMKDQEKLSAKLSILGFILPQIILFIIAIVYTGTHGKYTSYRRGIFLAALFFALYAGLTFNMLPGLRAGTWKAGANVGDNVNLVISLVTYAAMAILTYFSAVGGDGLWKSMGRSLWPRWNESNYGAAVLRSMREGYFLAFILLGAQSIILLVLEKSLGSFASSDASQSMYNMTYPLLLPLLAWCAGISEELQSRLLGIGVFRSWFVGGARKLLRREPSRRTAIVLTTVAMIPPGLLWAMGHVGYAIYPVYTRIIELVIMSILFGWFMLRFGVITVIFAHVTLDATLMGMQMMFDGLPGDFFGGVFSLLMPGLAGIVIWWLHGAISGRNKIAT